MRDIAIRYVETPGFIDKAMYRVYVPIRGEMVPFNFFNKTEAFKFAENLIDGEFTEKEIEDLFRAPSMPEKPKKIRVQRESALPLSERAPGAWTPEKRVRVTYDTLKEKEWVSSTDVYHAAVDQGDDSTSQGTYLSILQRLEGRGILLIDKRTRPAMFKLREDVPFEKIAPIPRRPLTHRQVRKIKSTRTEEGKS